MRELRTEGMVWDDAELTEFLNRFAARLIATGPARSHQFEFFAVRDKSINAFALPGGFIGIHTGLLAAAGQRVRAGDGDGPRDRPRDAAAHRAHAQPTSARRR